MQDIRNDAARLSLLHDFGVISANEVVRWADDLIVSEAKPCQELIDLSTSSAKGVGDALRSLARGADVWLPIEAALPRILEFVTAKPDQAPIAARAFYHIAVDQKYEVPKTLRFFLNAEDDFDLAESGIYRFDEVYHRFVDAIKAAIAAYGVA